jgi:hypothetical protein
MDNGDLSKIARRKRYTMKKEYQDVALEIVFLVEDTVRCSNTYEFGDDVAGDIFD